MVGMEGDTQGGRVLLAVRQLSGKWHCVLERREDPSWQPSQNVAELDSNHLAQSV